MTTLIDKKILRLLKCPHCVNGELTESDDRLMCKECGRSYSVVDNVPDLLPDNGSIPDEQGADKE
jgi:uncharacterized protein YbaR (Trm112 family)